MANEQSERPTIAVAPSSDDDAALTAARELARRFDLPLIDAPASAAPPPELLLWTDGQCVEFGETRRRGARRIRVDLVRGRLGLRRKHRPSKRQPLARAIGLKKSPPYVLDATAGFATDAFTLACLGCRVTAVERCGPLVALVENALERAIAEGGEDARAAALRMELVHADAAAYLDALDDQAAPDVVYLDPMYPAGRSSALPKKTMQLCRMMVGDDADAAELFDCARRVARRRVVVKRHPHAPPLAPNPSLRIESKRVRFDVYLRA